MAARWWVVVVGCLLRSGRMGMVGLVNGIGLKWIGWRQSQPEIVCLVGVFLPSPWKEKS